MPTGGYSTFPQPPGIRSALIDPETGLLATEFCPQVFTEVFVEGGVPTEVCNLHQSFADQVGTPPPVALRRGDEVLAPAPPERPAEPSRSPHPFRSWLRRLFGGGGPDSHAGDDRGGKGQDGGRGKGTGAQDGGQGGGRKPGAGAGGGAGGTGGNGTGIGGDRDDRDDRDDGDGPPR